MSTTQQELEAIFDEVGINYGELIPSSEEMRSRLLNALSTLIERERKEARIDELESLFIDHDERKVRHIDGTKLITLDDRLAELMSESEK
jgi:hypothetical protein